MRLILIKFCLICCLGLSLTGCESLKNFSFKKSETEEEYAGWSAEKFRKEANAALDSGNYKKAIELYEALESRYPFGESSAQTQLDIAYAYYKNDEPDAAIAAADRFIKTNPRNPSVDYAYYLKGLVNYNRGFGFLDRYLPIDSSQRDQTTAQEAYNNFDELIRRFPNSKYVPDAKQRMIALRNNLAMHEIHIARYYMKRKAYIAAADRASGVIEKYDRTPAVPYALQIMQEAYSKLELPNEAKEVALIYEKNFPNGPPVPEHQNATFSHKVWDFIGLEK